ncbi:hypothetical protein B0H13DRAFT_2318859 [Mycena leptocephala]|nr:hypothetical protein B0H13DRAFT_2318859 [Mycena leptocephala]
MAHTRDYAIGRAFSDFTARKFSPMNRDEAVYYRKFYTELPQSRWRSLTISVFAIPDLAVRNVKRRRGLGVVLSAAVVAAVCDARGVVDARGVLRVESLSGSCVRGRDLTQRAGRRWLDEGVGVVDGDSFVLALCCCVSSPSRPLFPFICSPNLLPSSSLYLITNPPFVPTVMRTGTDPTFPDGTTGQDDGDDDLFAPVQEMIFAYLGPPAPEVGLGVSVF